MGQTVSELDFEQLWDRYDADQRGVLRESTVQELVQEVWARHTPGVQLDPRVVELVLQEVDPDRDGFVVKAEFLLWASVTLTKLAARFAARPPPPPPRALQREEVEVVREEERPHPPPRFAAFGGFGATPEASPPLFAAFAGTASDLRSTPAKAAPPAKDGGWGVRLGGTAPSTSAASGELKPTPRSEANAAASSSSSPPHAAPPASPAARSGGGVAAGSPAGGNLPAGMSVREGPAGGARAGVPGTLEGPREGTPEGPREGTPRGAREPRRALGDVGAPLTAQERRPGAVPASPGKVRCPHCSVDIPVGDLEARRVPADRLSRLPGRWPPSSATDSTRSPPLGGVSLPPETVCSGQVPASFFYTPHASVWTQRGLQQPSP